jgi:hypothetical protein
MLPTRRALASFTRAILVFGVLSGLGLAAAEAQARPYGRGGSGHHHFHGGWRGPVWGGIGFGLGVGVGSYYSGAPWYYGAPVYPTYVVPAPVYEVGTAPAPTARPAPEPIIYPRSGQSAAQTEADRQACERWATTQPSAMADATVFQRASAACMEGRGYTVR